MFSSRGLFSKIACPVAEQCDLPNCFFWHDDQSQRARDAMDIDQPVIREHPIVKRPRATPQTAGLRAEPSSDVVKPTPAFMGTLITKKQQPPPSGSAPSIAPARVIPKQTQTPLKVESHQRLAAPEKRPVSPPPLKKQQQAPAASAVKPHAVPIKHATEPLNPRMLVQAPASHQTRMLYLKKLHDEIKRLNEQAQKSSDMQSMVLAPSQLITLALDEEEKIARENFSVYANVIKLRMVAYKKMTMDAWKLHVLELSTVSESPERQKIRPIVKGERILETGLSESEERQVLRHLFAKQHGLEKYGYVTGAPSAEEILEAKRGDEAAKNWEECCRCRTRFQVFPDRREDGGLTEGGTCVYHPGRLIANSRGQERTHNCCNEGLGRSVGCTTYPTHVYKVESPKRLAIVLQYERTPDNLAIGLDKAVSLDCEMGYTTYGFELIRLTVLSWPKGEKTLDVLVRPFGHLLDLNTRYSGITPEHFADAVPYESSGNGGSLQIVGSPKEARDLFFKQINPSTPIVGHGLDNDLAALRIIHPCIVDTALLCQHSAGLPYRRALKSLARDYLHRVIQDAGLAGHDSAEDAKAAGDVALELVKRKWNKMKDEGWKAEEGQLVPPKMVAPEHHTLAQINSEKVAQEESRRQTGASRMEYERQAEEQKSRKRSREDDDDKEEVKVELKYE